MDEGAEIFAGIRESEFSWGKWIKKKRKYDSGFYTKNESFDDKTVADNFDAKKRHLRRKFSKRIAKKNEFKQLNGRIIAASDWETICDLIESRSSSFNEVNIATCWLRLGQLVRDDPKAHRSLCRKHQTRLDQLLDASRKTAANWSPRCISNAILGIAYTKDAFRGRKFIQLFQSRVHSSLPIFPFQEKVNVMWALATLKVDPGEDFVLAMCESVKPNILHAKPRAVSNFFWSCVVLGHQPDDSFQALIEEYLSQDIVSLRPQDLTLFLWGLANTGQRPSSAVFNNLIKQSLEKYNEFSGQNLSNFFWSCATLDLRPPLPLVQALEVQAMKVMTQLSSQAVSNILWAYAILDIQPGRIFFQILQAHTVVIMPTCKAQSLSLLLWAMATLDRQPAPGFVRSLVAHTIHQLPEFMPRNVANLSWAFASLRIHPGENLLENFDEYAHRNRHKFCSQSFCNLLWAFACLCHAPSLRFFSVSTEIIMKFPYDSLWVSHCLWAIALFVSLDVDPPITFIDSFIVILIKNVRADDPNLSVRFWNAFYQFALAGRFGRYNYIGRLPEELVNKSRRISQSSALEVSISNSQKEVFEVLRKAGLSVESEARVFEDCFSVDILYQPSGAERRIAIEVDGPAHYRADNTRENIGKTQLRNWMLENAGYHVVVIRGEEWYRLSMSKEAQRKYLLACLASVVSDEDRERLSPLAGHVSGVNDRQATSPGGSKAS